ncbi:hypothetical protein DL89DRAFT_268832 [Linderina pennispora]|uniref:CHCH domain-containing protein n=1 Tax=Linderina pennispora TaxID=61395 RepID=A0A1Y1W521_9FUNG|nr:uncharacterized protein DL89DRAFT_268832 [Linderina pennispora]KAJ1952402.1 hypothetical protein EC988_003573 [Linderina pennispora]ORX68316.1 hypothetical protein DL89DRAFT_268832 [Linderina pennispora]
MSGVNVPKLRVKPKKIKGISPCAVEMSSLVTCWASTSIDDARCAEVAKNLISCMQKAKAPGKARSSVNFHLARLGKQVLGK